VDEVGDGNKAAVGQAAAPQLACANHGNPCTSL